MGLVCQDVLYPVATSRQHIGALSPVHYYFMLGGFDYGSIGPNWIGWVCTSGVLSGLDTAQHRRQEDRIWDPEEVTRDRS